MSVNSRFSAWIDRPVRQVALGLGIVTLVAAGAGAALATPPTAGLACSDVAKGRLSDDMAVNMRGPTDFYIQDVVLQPGANTGWHTHPGIEHTIVKSGSLVVIPASCTPHTYTAGQAIYNAPNVTHFARNDSSAPVEIYVTYTVPAGAAVRGDAAAPCP